MTFNPLPLPTQMADKLACEKFCLEQQSPEEQLLYRLFRNCYYSAIRLAQDKAGGGRPTLADYRREWRLQQDSQAFLEGFNALIVQHHIATHPRRSEKGHLTGETQYPSAPPSGGTEDRQDPSDQRGAGDHVMIDTQALGVSPPAVWHSEWELQKQPPRPKVREPSAGAREAVRRVKHRQAESLAQKIQYGPRLVIGSGRHINLDYADAPPLGSKAWSDYLELARTTGRDGITAFSRMREIELHSPELPTDLNAMRLSDQISQKQCMTAIAAADARLLGPRLALPRDLIENATI